MTILAISAAAAIALIAVSVSEAGGVPVSISSTYYEQGKDGWIFQALMATAALSLLPVWMDLSSDGLRWMVFLSCASLLFVAASPCFREELEGKVHYTSAAVCCFCAVLWQICEGLWDITLWCGVIGLMLTLQDRRNWCWWMESAVLASVYLNLFRLI